MLSRSSALNSGAVSATAAVGNIPTAIIKQSRILNIDFLILSSFTWFFRIQVNKFYGNYTKSSIVDINSQNSGGVATLRISFFFRKSKPA